MPPLTTHRYVQGTINRLTATYQPLFQNEHYSRMALFSFLKTTNLKPHTQINLCRFILGFIFLKWGRYDHVLHKTNMCIFL